MARPCCPLCADAFSVAKVSAIARSDLLPLAAVLQPPSAPGAVGRYLLPSLVAAAGLYVLTGFALLCPALVLCGGVLAELFLSWERADEGAAYQHARACWQAAYYCSTHDTVFLPGEPMTVSPEQFAQLTGRGAAEQSAPMLEPGVSQAPAQQPFRQEPAVAEGRQLVPLPEAQDTRLGLEAA